MKRIVFVLILSFIASSLQSQNLKSIIYNWNYLESYLESYSDSTREDLNICKTPIVGFWNLTFGMNQAQVSSIVKYKPYLKEPTGLYFEDISLGGVSFDSALISFYKGKLYSSFFTIKELNDDKALRIINSISEGIVDKYGIPHKVSFNDDRACYIFWIDKYKNRINLAIEEYYKYSDYKYNISVLYNYNKISSQKEKDEKAEF